MINYNQEYYSSPYYFFLKDRGDKISLYYSVEETLTESRKKDKKMDFDKKDSPKVKSLISKILSKKKTPKSTDEVEKELDELRLLLMIVRQEVEIQVAYLPEILKFEDALIYPN